MNRPWLRLPGGRLLLLASVWSALSCGNSAAVNNPSTTGGAAGSDGVPASSGGAVGSGGTASGSGASSDSGSVGTGGSTLVEAGGGARSGTGGMATAAAGAGASSATSGQTGNGGSGITGGSGAGGSSDATGGGGSARCSGLLLCDDFESYPLSSQPNGQWRVMGQGSSTLTVDTTHAKSGQKAAHFHGTVGANGANAIYMVADQAPVFPVSGNVLFVRFLLYVERYPTGSPMHTRLAWIGTTGMDRNQDGSGYTMSTYNGIEIEKLTSSGMRDTSQQMTDKANTGKWLCWEFEINNTEGPPPQSNGKVMPHMWREGQPVSLAISGTGITWAPAPFNLLQFALFAYQADTLPADFWIDDIAMNNQRIGCPQ